MHCLGDLMTYLISLAVALVIAIAAVGFVQGFNKVEAYLQTAKTPSNPLVADVLTLAILLSILIYAGYMKLKWDGLL